MIVSDFSPPALYVATYGQRLNFKQIPVDGGRRNITAPAAVDYDPVERRVYWTQWSGKWTNEGNICRCDLKGNFYQVLVKQLDCEYAFLTLICQRSERHTVVTGLRYCYYAPLLHWFCVVIGSIVVQDR